MKITTIIGARPQFIKAATVSRAIITHKADINEVIIHTGQHYDKNMSEVFFDELDIPKPNYNLGVGGGTHGQNTGRMLEGIEKVLLDEKPDWVLVYGDTDSTLAGALAASKLHIPVAHVEAGLRSYNTNMPEEINRILTDRISQYLFCPTSTAVNNLKKEGYDHHNAEVIMTGDVMLDAAMYYAKKAKKPKIDLKENFVLATVHRAENTDNLEKLTNIIEALNEINQETQVVLPLHPRTKKIIETNNIKTDCTIVDPVSYLEMVYLLKNTELVMTDSGGLQKEAYFFKKPCITFRDETEWVELIDGNHNSLVQTDKDSIIEKFNHFVFSQDFSKKVYGEGDSSMVIIDILIN